MTESMNVTFGNAYLYNPQTREISTIDGEGNTIDRWAFTSYMSKRSNRWIFSDSSLALAILEEELKADVIEAIDRQFGLGARFHWVAVQLALPLIDLVGRLHDAPGGNGDVFRFGAKKVFPRRNLTPTMGQTEYNTSIDCLWTGLRCGLLHPGYITRKGGIDINVVPGASLAPLSFSSIRGEKILSIGAAQFVERTKSGLLTTIDELRADRSRMDGPFLKLWRERWGSHAA